MQSGRALIRVIHRIVHANPAFGPVHLAKSDLSDGYYRMRLHPEHVLRLATLPPRLDGEEPLVAVPLVPPMGWNESPPYFCAATETVADLANASIRAGTTFPPHRLESAAETGRDQDLWSTRPAHLSPQPRDFAQGPLRYVDVHLDDLIGVAQGPPDDLAQLRRVILHNLDRVFRPLEPSDDPNRREPTSLKRLLQGDGLLTTRKTVLGWTLDCARCTLELTDRRRDRSPGGTSFGIPAYEGANVRQEV